MAAAEENAIMANTIIEVEGTTRVVVAVVPLQQLSLIEKAWDLQG
jgi:hypothetical protein